MLEEMIRKFRDAEGRSEFVIAVVCDIRNFSGFSVGRRAPEIAMFIRKFYEKLLSVYFTDAVFAKPTGDGLLMAFRYKYDQPTCCRSPSPCCGNARRRSTITRPCSPTI